MRAGWVHRWSRALSSGALALVLAIGLGSPAHAKTERTLPPRLEELIAEVVSSLSNPSTIAEDVVKVESKWKTMAFKA